MLSGDVVVFVVYTPVSVGVRKLGRTDGQSAAVLAAVAELPCTVFVAAADLLLWLGLRPKLPC